MDSENECSALESVKDCQAIYPKMILQVGEKGILINGSYGKNSKASMESSSDGEILQDDSKGEDGASEKLRSPTLSVTPDRGSPSYKGSGLKKWRRIRRDHVKEINSFADSSKVLKRDLPASIQQSKPPFSSPNMKQHSEGSIGSENKKVGIIGSLTFPILNPESRFAVGSDIAVTADSDSEDRGSKTSTAASGSKTRQVRHVREKSRIMNATGRSLGSSAVHVQKGKGHSEGSKKLRGVRVKVEQKNSLSSLESDSVNSIFVHGPFTVNSSGRQCGKSGKYVVENVDGTHPFEEFEEVLVNDDATAFLEEEQESRDQDFLADSILSLQSAQEALEREVQKLGAIGREANPWNSSINDNNEYTDFAESPDRVSADHLDSQSMSQKSCLETQVLQMTENVKVLEMKLEESTAMLEAKELLITEIQRGVNDSKLLDERSLISMDSELDGLFKQKIEAEVTYLVLTRTIQTMNVVGGHGSLFKKQKVLVEEQVDILGSEDVLQMQSKVKGY